MLKKAHISLAASTQRKENLAHVWRRKQTIGKRKPCVRPTARLEFSARKDNTFLNAALVGTTAGYPISLQLDPLGLGRPMIGSQAQSFCPGFGQSGSMSVS